jgi:hypothetical protein
MPRIPLMFLASTLTLLATGCTDGSGVACLAVLRPGIEVEVRDGATDEPIADLARGIVEDGAFADSLRIIGYDSAMVPSVLGAAGERPGNYKVRIERAGYEAWDTTGVSVQAGECGVIPVQLAAHLSRTS